MDVRFNSAGLYSTHGLHTASKRMVAFVFLVFFFSASGYHGSVPGVLVSRPLTMLALELLRKHADKACHKEAVLKADEFHS